MLQIVDTMLAQASGNAAFDAQIPLLDTSVKSIISIASIFTSAMFEFFVTVQPFEERAVKSLVIRGPSLFEQVGIVVQLDTMFAPDESGQFFTFSHDAWRTYFSTD